MIQDHVAERSWGFDSPSAHWDDASRRRRGESPATSTLTYCVIPFGEMAEWLIALSR